MFMVKMICLFFCFMGLGNSLLYGQTQSIQQIPVQTYHTYNKYNSFLLNPTYSYDKRVANSRNKNGYIAAFGRIEKVSFDNAPSNYQISYSKLPDERMAFSAVLSQYRVGVISHSGLLANYTYNVEYSRYIDIALGANLRYQRSTLASGISSQVAIGLDPALVGFTGNSLIQISPGANLRYKDFSFGITAHNVVNLFLDESSSLYGNTVFAFQTVYTRPFSRRSPNTFRGILFLEQESGQDITIGLNTMLSNSKYGFFHFGYHTLYGPSLGFGLNVTPVANIGYTIENSFSSAGFGVTHEVVLAYNFVKHKRKRKVRTPKVKEQKLPERRELSEAEKLVALEQSRQANKINRINRQNSSPNDTELLTRFDSQIVNGKFQEAQETLLLIQKSQFIKQVDKIRSASRLERIINSQEIASSSQELVSDIEDLLASGNLVELRKRSSLLRSNNRIPLSEKNSLLKRISELEASEVSSQELVSDIEDLLASGNLVELRKRSSLLRSNTRIPLSEKNSLLKRISELEASEVASQELVSDIEEFIRNENLVELRKRLPLLKLSSSIPEETKEALLLSISKLERDQKESDALVEKVLKLLEENNLEELQKRSSLVRSSNFIPIEMKKSLLVRIENLQGQRESSKVLLKEVETLDEETPSSIVLEKIAEIEGNVFLSDEDRTRVVSNLQRILTKQKVKLANEGKKAEIQEKVNQIIANNSIIEAKEQIVRIKNNSLFEQEEKDLMISRLSRVIDSKVEADKDIKSDKESTSNPKNSNHQEKQNSSESIAKRKATIKRSLEKDTLNTAGQNKVIRSQLKKTVKTIDEGAAETKVQKLRKSELKRILN